MHNQFHWAVVVCLLLILIGCSSQRQPAAPVVGGGDSFTGEYGDDDNMMRYLAAVEDRHAAAIYFRSSYQAEGNTTYDSRLVDCVAASSWKIPDTDADYLSYILSCDSKRRWDNPTSYPHTTIMRTDNHLNYMTPAKTEYDIFSSYPIEDPDACTLAIHDDHIWCFVYDADDNEIYGWTWEINTNPLNLGELTNGSYVQYYNSLDCDDVDINIDHVSGMAWVPLDSEGNEWHLICCDPIDTQVVVLDDNGDVVERNTNYGYDKPIDTCIIWIDSDEWIVYVAVQESTTRNEDYIHCYYHDNTGYDDPETMTCNTGGNYFPFVLGLDVRAFDDTDLDGDQCIGVLMLDVDDMEGYRIRQGYCGRTNGTHDNWTTELDSDSFEDPSSKPDSPLNLAESFAMFKLSWGTDEDNCWAFANYYLIGDRDPQLVEYGEEDSAENSLSGKNLKVYSNHDTLLCF